MKSRKWCVVVGGELAIMYGGGRELIRWLARVGMMLVCARREG
jgi:hypothetical protein